MASFQRDHWFLVVLRCLLLFGLIGKEAAAERNKFYHVSTLCVRERYHPLYKMIDGAVLTSEGENNLECVITFQTDSILQRFMLRFERLALDCNDHLYIFDGAHTLGKHEVDLSCRSTRANVGTIFTLSSFVTLKYETDSWSPAGNGFKLIITAVRNSQFGCRDFHCLNTFCISQDLTCDRVNHCGDNSDETSFAYCVDDTNGGQILGLGVSVFVAVVMSIFIVCCVCVIGTAVCLCRREPLQPRHPPTGHVTYPSPAPHSRFQVPQVTRAIGRGTTPIPGKHMPISPRRRTRIQCSRRKRLLSSKMRSSQCRSARQLPQPPRTEWLV
ncbi:uncharacterized protein [Centruroides vittatus]|uniref:uncharacterized protein isoform X1 n=1 Tax=Centruroides vittatus TaxID=120091 RepID=UPI00350F36C4